MSVPTGVPLTLQAALGSWTGTSATSIAVYDGDPGGAAGTFTQLTGTVTSSGAGWSSPVVTPALNSQIADITGAAIPPTGTATAATLASLYEQDNLSITFTSVHGVLYFVHPSGNPTTYIRSIKIAYPTQNKPLTGVGPFYVNYASGNDNNDGLSAATAWQHGPGDPNAGSFQVRNFGPSPGAVVYWEGDQDYFLGGYTGQQVFYSPLSGGSSTSARVTHTKRPGSGANPRWRGDEPQPTGWAAVPTTGDALTAPTGGNGPPAAVAAGIAEKLTLATAAASFMQFLTVTPATGGGKRLYPAQFPVPAGPAGWENSDSGTDAYKQVRQADYNTFVQWDPGTGIATLYDPDFLARYGAEGLVGYTIVNRIIGNVTEEKVIATGPNATTGKITWVGKQPYPGTSSADYFYAIRYHPRDLELPGQYAWSVDRKTCYGTFGAGFAGTRGITRLQRFVDWLGTVSHIVIDQIDMMFTAEDNTGNGGIAVNTVSGSAGTDFTLSNCTLSGFQSPSRNMVLFFAGTVRGINISEVRIDDAQGRGVNLSPATTSSAITDTIATISNFTGTRMGRTADYNQFGTPYTGDLNPLVTHQNIRVSNCGSFHGNGLTNYGNTHNTSFTNCEAMNSSNPVTMQCNPVQVAGSLYSRNNHWKGIIATGRRTKPGTRPPPGSGAWQANTNAVTRIDGGETDTLFEQYVSCFGASGALSINSSTGPNNGMTFRNAVVDDVTWETGALTGVTFENVLILGQSWDTNSTADLTSNGATLTGNVTLLSGTANQWNGVFTSQMQQFLTVKPGFTAGDASAQYQDIVLGLGWNIPAWGTPFSLADCALDNTNVAVGFDANEAFASVINTQVDSAISLPPGVNSNDLFFLDRGQIGFLATAVAGTYTVAIDQNNSNPHLTGPATLRTLITVTVS